MSAVLKLVSDRKNIDGRQKVVLTDNGRVCLRCDEGKSWDKFHKDVHGYNQKTATCIDCRNEKGREVYKENPAVRRSGMKNRPDKLKRLYGVTYTEIEQVLVKQNFKCANRACGKHINLEVSGTKKNRAVIDHDHATGKFRALLCIPCNSALGLIETKEDVLLGLMEYKTKHSKGV